MLILGHAEDARRKSAPYHRGYLFLRWLPRGTRCPKLGVSVVLTHRSLGKNRRNVRKQEENCACPRLELLRCPVGSQGKSSRPSESTPLRPSETAGAENFETRRQRKCSLLAIPGLPAIPAKSRRSRTSCRAVFWQRLRTPHNCSALFCASDLAFPGIPG